VGTIMATLLSPSPQGEHPRYMRLDLDGAARAAGGLHVQLLAMLVLAARAIGVSHIEVTAVPADVAHYEAVGAVHRTDHAARDARADVSAHEGVFLMRLAVTHGGGPIAQSILAMDATAQPVVADMKARLLQGPAFVVGGGAALTELQSDAFHHEARRLWGLRGAADRAPNPAAAALDAAVAAGIAAGAFHHVAPHCGTPPTRANQTLVFKVLYALGGLASDLGASVLDAMQPPYNAAHLAAIVKAMYGGADVKPQRKAQLAAALQLDAPQLAALLASAQQVAHAVA